MNPPFWFFFNLICNQQPQKPLSNSFYKPRLPYLIRHFDFFLIWFVISDPKNPWVTIFKQIWLIFLSFWTQIRVQRKKCLRKHVESSYLQNPCSAVYSLFYRQFRLLAIQSVLHYWYPRNEICVELQGPPIWCNIISDNRKAGTNYAQGQNYVQKQKHKKNETNNLIKIIEILKIQSKSLLYITTMTCPFFSFTNSSNSNL